MKDDGGSAFPFGQISETTGQPINGCFSPGMTLRDWFAGRALTRIIPSEGWIAHAVKECSADAAQQAYAIADAMLAERKKDSQ